MAISLESFFRHYKGEPQQVEAVQILQAAMPANLLQDDSAWVIKYREKPPGPAHSNPLNVPYFWQQDNGPTGWRECQTSSIAMCLAFLKVPGIKDDTDYLAIVNRYGDTTVQETHKQALHSLGVKARFSTVMSKQDIIDQIDAGRPCAVGMLHNGPVSAPSGGGHYITIRGYTNDAALVHDPYGAQDLVNGGFAAAGQLDGKDETYSWKNFLPRWDIGGGWGWVFE